MAERLTIVLPLKGRAEYTRRWFDWADRSRFPFAVVVADGGDDSGLEAALGTYSHVRHRYVRYPYDADYARFYAKMTDALSRVTTPYVTVMDNDCFHIAEGLA